MEVFLDDTEDLTDRQLGRINRLAELLLSLPDVDLGTVEEDYQSVGETRGVSQELRRFLQRIEEYDEGPNPVDRLGTLLIDLKPSFLLFTEADRELRSTYELSDNTERRARALGNLADLADLDLDELLEVASEGDPGRRVELLDLANTRLREIFSKSWKQSDIAVRVDIQETELQIFVSIPGGGYSQIEERSAGLLSFVALRSFLAKQHLECPPILLVDEAETHLHYDAQADIVNLFSDQELASKVIYTTHSAGCLPRDLGNGIRVVVPLEGQERSTVKKSVWEGSAAGFSPLIYGMGATTFAFLPARHVLLTEGPTDAMLLPTLFREATSLDNLSFQVAPGLSSVSQARIFGLTSEGGAVAFLTDGDDAGETLRKRLIESGVEENRIFGLNGHGCDGTVLEDLLDAARYAEAVSNVIRDFQETRSAPSIDEFPDTGRPDALKRWCKRRKLSVPDKNDIAQRLLDMKSSSAQRAEEVTLLDEKHDAGMRRLYQDICDLFSERQV